MQELFNMMVKQAKNEGLSGFGIIWLGDLYSQLAEMPAEAPVAVEYYRDTVWAGELSSYRGYYEDLSFDLGGRTLVSDVLEQIDNYLGGESYEGYKGGEYYAHDATLVWVSEYGNASGIGVTGAELRDGTVFLATVDTNDR